ncbi:MAG: hypothetical protein R3300_12480 [Candidatus Promineifilaceae bacterium]|nr:hypothetical protein [Candidatus Promineifilaceae bacterium]
MASAWNVLGSPERHDQLVDKLLNDAQFMAFPYCAPQTGIGPGGGNELG